MRRPEVSTENAINAKNSDLSMEQLLQLAKSSRNGAAFTALWNGSLEGYSSPSEADLALCSHLAFWTGRDAAKMDPTFSAFQLKRAAFCAISNPEVATPPALAALPGANKTPASIKASVAAMVVGIFAPSATALTPFLINTFAASKSNSFCVAQGSAIGKF